MSSGNGQDFVGLKFGFGGFSERGGFGCHLGFLGSSNGLARGQAMTGVWLFVFIQCAMPARMLFDLENYHSCAKYDTVSIVLASLPVDYTILPDRVHFK